MMKKITRLFVLSVALFLAACNINDDIDNDTPAEIDDYLVYELCWCEEHYAHESLRRPTPPMNMHEILGRQEHDAMVADFVRDFETIHTGIYIFGADHPSSDEWYDTIILWSDIPLRDFSFVILNVWDEDDGMRIFTEATPLVVDRLLPGEAIVLHVRFFHYLRPQAAIFFTDETGAHQRMFIRQDMSNSCIYYFLSPVYPAHIVEWHEISTAAHGEICPFSGQYVKDFIDGLWTVFNRRIGWRDLETGNLYHDTYDAETGWGLARVYTPSDDGKPKVYLGAVHSDAFQFVYGGGIYDRYGNLIEGAPFIFPFEHCWSSGEATLATSFSLFDLDGSGMPVIVVDYLHWLSFSFQYGAPSVLFKFIDGEYQPIGEIGFPYEFFIDPYGEIIIFFDNALSGPMGYYRLHFADSGIELEPVTGPDMPLERALPLTIWP